MTYPIIVLIFAGFVFYLISCNNKPNGKELKKETTERKKVDPNNNPYNDLRNMALSATEKQIGVELPKDETKIYGLVMDWDLGEGTATLVTFISGDSSLYLSSGGGMIGGGGHENVKKVSTDFLRLADRYLNQTIKTESNELPKKDGVNFYFLTNKGKYFSQEEMKNIENESSEWLPLFIEGNKLISEIRIVSDKQEN